MALILNIETSANLCSVALGNDGELVSFRETDAPNSHASNCPVFVNEVLKEAGLKLKQLDAIAVSEGPGSYTGLRIGVSLAKGMCYSLDIPLIALSTLQIMALEAALDTKDKTAFYAPMIDARRMEVYTALYDHSNKMINPVSSQILSDTYNEKLLDNNIIYYSGNGALKLKTILKHKNARFLNIFGNSAKNMVFLSQVFYNINSFTDAPYFEPMYLKLFHKLL